MKCVICLFILCVGMFAFMCICEPCGSWCSWRSEHGAGYLGNGVTDSCELLCACLELNPGPLQGPQVDPALHSWEREWWHPRPLVYRYLLLQSPTTRDWSTGQKLGAGLSAAEMWVGVGRAPRMPDQRGSWLAFLLGSVPPLKAESPVLIPLSPTPSGANSWI